MPSRDDDFANIRKSGERVNLTEEEVIELVDKVRDEIQQDIMDSAEIAKLKATAKRSDFIPHEKLVEKLGL